MTLNSTIHGSLREQPFPLALCQNVLSGEEWGHLTHPEYLSSTLSQRFISQLLLANIMAGNDGPTEWISSFVDGLLQPIAKSQKSYLKDTTDFVNFIERRNLPGDVFLVSLDVTSLYTNIPQEEGINTVCKAYQTFYGENTPIPTQSLRRILKLILQENSFEFNGKNYLQTHGTAMGTKMAVAFANLYVGGRDRNTELQQNWTS